MRLGDELVEQAARPPRQILSVQRNRVGQDPERSCQHGVEQVILTTEVGIDQPLVRASPLGYVVDPCPGESRAAN